MAESSCFNLQDAIIEGFICPSCLKSFGRPALLVDHFSKNHIYAAPTENNETFNTVSFPTLGKMRHLTSEFNKLRREKIDIIALETNLLLIRLEKWSNLPEIVDIAQRHSLEQTIVPWIEAHIDLCPRCGTRFGLSWPVDGGSTAHEPTLRTPNSPNSLLDRARQGLRSVTQMTTALIDGNPAYRRMHHCRLCGHIICAGCSCFLTKEEVTHIVSTCSWAHSKGLKSELLSPDVIVSPEENMFKKGMVFLKRSGSGSSLDSIAQNKSKASPYLRLCEVCRSLLESKMNQIEERNTVPVEMDMFKELKEEMEKVKQKMPLFASMAGSLNSGEERYVLEIAKNLRHEILQCLHKIDTIGKDIAGLDATAPSSSPATKKKKASSQARINHSVGMFARRFVQTHLPPMRVLPSEDEHRRLAQRRTSQFTAQHIKPPPVQSPLGWVPSSGSLQSMEAPIGAEEQEEKMSADPRTIVMRQMDTVADYLSQARAANRSADEIRTLASNLADLEAELKRLSSRKQ